jgi:VWFA-related protein
MDAWKKGLWQFARIGGLVVTIALAGIGLAQEIAPEKLEEAWVLTKASEAPGIGGVGRQAENNPQTSESSTRQSGPTVRVKVSLVTVKVVVRDGGGKPVSGLSKESFEIYDQGKRQAIYAFDAQAEKVEDGTKTSIKKTESKVTASGGTRGAEFPDRFVGLVIDDVHLSSHDVNKVRLAAQKFVEEMGARDRVAIFSTSGQLKHEFTSDAEGLKKTLQGIFPRPIGNASTRNCPKVTLTVADVIENKHDPDAMKLVVEETVQCAFNGDHRNLQAAQMMAKTAVKQALRTGEAENRVVFQNVEDALRELAGKPGERVLLMISPGFLLTEQMLEEKEVIELANRANIIMNTIDARGLSVTSGGQDISERNTDTFETGAAKGMYRMESEAEQSDVLGDFAGGTGGTFFRNSNDLAGGLRMTGGRPEFSYVLGFSPQNVKADGKYHTIEVKLTNKTNYLVQARRGYYAPRPTDGPDEQERVEMEAAVYSFEETGDLLGEVRTQVVAGDKNKIHLEIETRVAVQNAGFRVEDGKRADTLKLATALFDGNGMFVTGNEKVLALKLDDAAFARLSSNGLLVRLSFEVRPGAYRLRQVLRDSEDGQIAAKNRSVEIP